MGKFTKILSIVVIILSLNGYRLTNKENSELNLTKSNTKNGTDLIQEKNSSKNFLKQLGITKKEDKIIIDINKTKEFLKIVGENIHNKTIQIKKKVLELEKSAIKKIDTTKIIIDLNKSKNILEDIAKDFEKIIQDNCTKQNK